METSEMILLGIAAIIALFILVRIAKTIFKVIIVVAILAALFFLLKGGSLDSLMGPSVNNIFQNTTITQLMDQHCSPEKRNDLKCKCIVTPVYNDLTIRFDSKELAELEENKKRMAEEMLRSLQNKRAYVQECMGDKKESGLKWLKKVKDILEIVSE